MSHAMLAAVATLLLSSAAYGVTSEKPGECPEPVGPGVCAVACQDDLSCEGTQKCCSNGCGMVWPDPVRLCEPECQNGGVCTLENQCDRPPGYAGPACQQVIQRVPALTLQPLPFILAGMGLLALYGIRRSLTR